MPKKGSQELRPFPTRWSDEDWTALQKLALGSGEAAGRVISVMDVLRQLVRDAAQKGRPVRVQDKA
jgi:hypothetical protein